VFKHFEDSLGVIVKRMVEIEVKTGGDPEWSNTLCSRKGGENMSFV